MADWNSADPASVADDAMAALERESRKLADLGKHWDEASTTVRSKDHSLEMTFDGRGELVDLVFNAQKYRAMPPAQLAKVIIETQKRGRAEAQQKMNELMGMSDIPGLDLNGLTTGQVRPDEMLSALVGPMFETLNDFGVDVGRPRPADHKREERGNG
jgi:hypothetical protein